MGVAELSSLPIETLSDDQLEEAWRTADKLAAREITGRFAQTLVARPPNATRPDRYPVYTSLIQLAVEQGQSDQALDYLESRARRPMTNNTRAGTTTIMNCAVARYTSSAATWSKRTTSSRRL